MIYDKPYYVPTWVIIGATEHEDRVVKYFTERGAKEFAFPADKFEETLLSFKKQGWQHIFHKDKKQGDGWIIPDQLLMIALNQFVKQELNMASRLQILAPHKIDRFYKDGSDAKRMFYESLLAADATSVSRALKIKEACHDVTKKDRPQLFVSRQQKYDTRVVDRFSQQTVSVGDGAGYSINLLEANTNKTGSSGSRNSNKKGTKEGTKEEGTKEDVNIEQLIEDYFARRQKRR